MPFLAVEGDCDGESAEPAMYNANTDGGHAPQTTCNTTRRHYACMLHYNHYTSVLLVRKMQISHKQYMLKNAT